MDEEVIQKYKKAGEIAKKIVAFSKEIVKEGNSVLDVAKKIEAETIKEGGIPAWPVNISINSIAAHWTPRADEELVFKKGDVVKVDIGVHVDGYIADTAYTVEIDSNNWKELIEASKEACNAALEIIKPGVTLSEIGKIIEDTITQKKFNPIANLSGHGLDEYETHVPPTIPNFNNKSNFQIEEGTAVAIEPFATNGVGRVIDMCDSEIFKLENIRPVRLPVARKIIEYVANERKGLPFSKRWLVDKVGFGVEAGLRELKRAGVLHNYSVLKEESDGIVSQHEHTILVLDSPIVITK